MTPSCLTRNQVVINGLGKGFLDYHAYPLSLFTSTVIGGPRVRVWVPVLVLHHLKRVIMRIIYFASQRDELAIHLVSLQMA